MARVLSPKHGRDWRVHRGYLEGFFLVDGKRAYRGLGKLEDFERTDSGHLRTAKQLDAAIGQAWEAKRAQLEEALGPAGSERPILRLMDDWIEVSKAERREGTVRLYRAMRKAYGRAVGGHAVGTFTLAQADKFKLWLTKRELAPATVNMYLRNLRTFLHWAQARGHLERVPRIGMLYGQVEAPKALTGAQVGDFFAFLAARSAKARKPRRRREYANAELAVWLAAYTGLRSAAIRTLRRGRIDMTRRILYPETEGPLGSRTKRVVATIIQSPLFERIEAHLAAYPNEIYLLDDGSGQPAYRTKHVLTRAIGRAMRKALGDAAAGVRPMHGFRAYRARALREAGADLEVIRDMLAQSDIRVTAGYFPDPPAAQWAVIHRLEGKRTASIVGNPGEPAPADPHAADRASDRDK